MTSWNEFIYFALPAVVMWAIGAAFAWKDAQGRPRYLCKVPSRSMAIGFTLGGLFVFSAFIALLWMSLERPPLRTMGETRLWYSAFLPLAGIIVYVRWRYRWILSFSTMLATVFVCINLFKPEIHSKTLMPALQSPWFAPHVIVYMFCYAILGAATLASVWQLWKGRDQREDVKAGEMIDNLVYVGLAFMTIGMLFGALWAKEAWGHYWAWDPKETWAAATWLLYLGYIHFRLTPYDTTKTSPAARTRQAYWLLIVTFCCLQMCWWGINYLPTAQGNSVHTYNMR